MSCAFASGAGTGASGPCGVAPVHAATPVSSSLRPMDRSHPRRRPRLDDDSEDLRAEAEAMAAASTMVGPGVAASGSGGPQNPRGGVGQAVEGGTPRAEIPGVCGDCMGAPCVGDFLNELPASPRADDSLSHCSMRSPGIVQGLAGTPRNENRGGGSLPPPSHPPLPPQPPGHPHHILRQPQPQQHPQAAASLPPSSATGHPLHHQKASPLPGPTSMHPPQHASASQSFPAYGGFPPSAPQHPGPLGYPPPVGMPPHCMPAMAQVTMHPFAQHAAALAVGNLANQYLPQLAFMPAMQPGHGPSPHPSPHRSEEHPS